MMSSCPKVKALSDGGWRKGTLRYSVFIPWLN